MLKDILSLVAEALHDEGYLDVQEAFIDGTFAAGLLLQSDTRVGCERDELALIAPLICLSFGFKRVTAMSTHITGFRAAAVIAFAGIFLVGSQLGYGQNTFGQTVQCQPFQQTLKYDLTPGELTSASTFRVGDRTRITIEMVALRIDATAHTVAPTVAAIVTTVGPMRSAYYVPIPFDAAFVTPSRPLALMQAGPLHADGGTVVALSVSVDPQYPNGTGRAEWSVSGQSCST